MAASATKVNGSVDRDLDHSRIDFNNVGTHRVGRRWAQHLARAHVEHAAMQRTLNGALAPVRVDLSLAQVAAPMGALVVDGVEGAIYVDQGELSARRRDDASGPGRQLLDLRYLNKSGNRIISSGLVRSRSRTPTV